MRPTWKLSAWILFTLAVLCTGLGVLYALSMEDELNNPRWATQRLLQRADPAWEEMVAAFRKGVPPATMPLPSGDPMPTLRAMVDFPLVDAAYFVSPDLRMTVLPKAGEMEPFMVNLKTWQPRFQMLPYNRATWPRAAADKAVWRKELLVRDALDHAPRYDRQPRFTKWDSQGYFVRGNKRDGWLIYSLDTGTFLVTEGQKILEAHGLKGALDWSFAGPSQRSYSLRPALPPELHGLSLVPGTMAIFQEQLGLQAEAAYVLLGLAGALILGVLGATRELRHVLHERSIALAQSNFVSGVSHEMRTPLTTIKMYAEMMEQGVIEAPEKRAAYLRTIGAECDRLTRLVENVLDYARISGKRREYRFERLEVRSLIEEAIASLEGPLTQAEVGVEVTAPENLTVTGDRDALVQGLVNLIGNAVKYAPGEKRIMVTATAADDAVKIAVRDFGPGIPRREQRRIFQPFYRLGSELTRQTTGSGLGLALVREYATAHRGNVELESKPGEGATFTLVLPRERKIA